MTASVVVIFLQLLTASAQAMDLEGVKHGLEPMEKIFT